jgi:exonuclease VII small subunit
MEGHAPLYVKVSEYEEVVTLLDNVKKKVSEARQVIQKLHELKAEEDKELAAWITSLNDIATRIDTIDKNLSQ